MVKFAKWLLLGYLLLKPFYLFSSGGLQIADGLLVASFGLFLIGSLAKKQLRSELSRTLYDNKLFLLFIICTFIINAMYFAYYPEFKFILSSIYFIFNLMAVVLFVSFFKDRLFLTRTANILKFSLGLQLAIWAVGLGRYYTTDRYMGTLNDPNQFGYFLLLSFLMIYVIDLLQQRKYTFIYYLITLFLIIQSGSTGMLMGLAIFSLLWAIVSTIRWLKSPYKVLRRIMHSLLGLFILLMPVVLVVLMSWGTISQSFSSSFDTVSIVDRVTEKTEKADGQSDVSILEDRGLDMILNYPHYILFGAGEGAFTRFNNVVNNYGQEIHSTLPALIFYYGIIPFIIIIIWMARKFKGVTWVYAIAYISLFTVSFILLNQRQAMFWVFIALAPFTLQGSAYLKRNTVVADVK